jgi:hypothetical protein
MAMEKGNKVTANSGTNRENLIIYRLRLNVVEMSDGSEV